MTAEASVEGSTEFPYNYVIVGGGICGLLVGISLQKQGLKVLILEKRPELGGRCSELDWEGTEFDHYGKWETIYGTSNPRDGIFFRLCEEVGLKLDWQEVHWQVGLIREGANRPELHSISDWTGGKALIDFAALIGGRQLEERQKQEIIRVLEKMSSYSYEELQEMTGVPLVKWLEENVKDSLVKSILGSGNGVTDIPAKDICFAHAAWTTGNMFKGNSVFITFKGGSSMETLIRPLVHLARSYGVEIRTDVTAKEIVIEDNTVRGVWVSDNSNYITTKIPADKVILNVPVYDAYPRLLKNEMLASGELAYVQRVVSTYSKDLLCYFILEKDAAKGLPGHFHAYDLTSGTPSYIGEIVQNKYFGAKVPDNADFLQIYIPGGRSGFGILNYEGSPYDTSYETLDAAKNKVLQVFNQYALPGIVSKIKRSGIIWAPNFGRYCNMTYDSNLGVKSEKIEGLYFASDSVDCSCVGLLGLEKVGAVAAKCIKLLETARR